MDGGIDPATEAAFSAAIEPNIDLTLHESRDAKLPDSSPATDSEPPAPVPIESDWAPIGVKTGGSRVGGPKLCV